MSAQYNKIIVHRFFDEVLNKGDLKAIDRYLSANYVNHDPCSPQGIGSGAGGIKQLLAIFRIAAPDLHFTLEDIVADGDKVAYRWTATGTHSQRFGPIPPTGKQATITGTSVVRFSGVEMAEGWHNWDAFNLVQQLGLINGALQVSLDGREPVLATSQG